MFIDAKKNGPWIEKVIKNIYSFFEPDFILIDDITFDDEMSRWWMEFSTIDCFNVVLFSLTRDLRNSCHSDKNLDCGFGLSFPWLYF